jgi:hypothetical protein
VFVPTTCPVVAQLKEVVPVHADPVLIVGTDPRCQRQDETESLSEAVPVMVSVEPVMVCACVVIDTLGLVVSGSGGLPPPELPIVNGP